MARHLKLRASSNMIMLRYETAKIVSFAIRIIWPENSKFLKNFERSKKNSEIHLTWAEYITFWYHSFFIKITWITEFILYMHLLAPSLTLSWMTSA